jgi:hypothetical protein
MASYDSPGYANLTPAGRVAQSTGAGAGSGAPLADPPEAGAVTVGVTRFGGGSYDQVSVTVDSDDVLTAAQAAAYDRMGLTGVTRVGVTGAGEGHVVTPRHPSAAPGSGAGAP